MRRLTPASSCSSHSLGPSSNMYKPKGTLALTSESQPQTLCCITSQLFWGSTQEAITTPFPFPVCDGGLGTCLDVAGVGYPWGQMGTELYLSCQGCGQELRPSWCGHPPFPQASTFPPFRNQTPNTPAFQQTGLFFPPLKLQCSCMLPVCPMKSKKKKIKKH